MLVHAVGLTLENMIAGFLHEEIRAIYNDDNLIVPFSHQLRGNRGLVLKKNCIAIDVMETKIKRDEVFHQCRRSRMDDSRDGSLVLEMEYGREHCATQAKTHLCKKDCKCNTNGSNSRIPDRLQRSQQVVERMKPTMNWTMYMKTFSVMMTTTRGMVSLLLQPAKRAMAKLCRRSNRSQLSTMRPILMVGMKRPT